MLRTLFLSTTALFAVTGHAFAKEAQPTDLEEVVVTGSQVRLPGRSTRR